MPERTRRALLLLLSEGLTPEEVAGKLRMSWQEIHEVSSLLLSMLSEEGGELGFDGQFPAGFRDGK